MRATVRQLLLALGFGAFAIAAQAQGGATPSSAATTSDRDAAAMTPKMIGDSAAQAKSRYEAALAACEQQTGEAKAECLGNAEADYQNAIDGAIPPGAPAAASRRAPANVDTTQPEATSSSSSEASGGASGTGSMSSVGAMGAGPTSGPAGGGGS